MKRLQLFPYAVAILCAGFAFAAPKDEPPVRPEAKYVEITSGTEDLGFDWIVNPFAVDAVKKEAAMYEVLATHKTIARFEGYRNIVCLGRPALCPERCGHSTVVAGFTIVSYRDHHKSGQYGDEQQKVFEMEVLLSSPGQPALVMAAVRKLSPGDVVNLEWQDLYIYDGCSSYPARVANLITPAKLLDESLLPPPAPSGKYRPSALPDIRLMLGGRNASAPDRKEDAVPLDGKQTSRTGNGCQAVRGAGESVFLGAERRLPGMACAGQ